MTDLKDFIDIFELLPNPMTLVAVKRKAAFESWTVPAGQITSTEQLLERLEELESKGTDGFGVITGDSFGTGICAIDCDGPAALAHFLTMFGDEPPNTIEFTSGRTGRCQYLFSVPEEFHHLLKKHVVKCVDGDDKSSLEFRWNGCYSVLPPSAHPNTDGYKWVNHPSTKPLQELPDSVLKFWADSVEAPLVPTRKATNNDKGKRETIPIIKLMSRDNRNAIKGVSTDRNNTGFKIVSDAIGVEQWLNDNGYVVDGEPYDILQEFKANCNALDDGNPPYTDKEVEATYRSAIKHCDGSPSTQNDEYLQNCVRSYLNRKKNSYGVPFDEDCPFAEESEIEIIIVNDTWYTASEKYGVYYHYVKKEAKLLRQINVQICDYLYVSRYSEDSTTEVITVELTFVNKYRTSRYISSRRMFDKTSVNELASMGCFVSIASANNIIQFVACLTKTCKDDAIQIYPVEKTGWIEGKNIFVMQEKTYGDNNSNYILHGLYNRRSLVDKIVNIDGTLQEWNQEIGRYANKNSQVTFAIGVALAPILMSIVDAKFTNRGFNFYGKSSTGKTTLAQITASVTGTKIRSWRSTDNALENTAANHTCLCMCLDEIAEVDEKLLDKLAYMLGNGFGKSRLTKDADSKEVKEWQGFYVSTGEKSMESIISKKTKYKEGQEVRFIDIPAKITENYGCFEDIHDKASSAVLAEHFGNATAFQTGTVFDDFLTKLVVRRKDKGFDNLLRQRYQAKLNSYRNSIKSEVIANSVSRAIQGVALTAVALELAIELNTIQMTLANVDWSMNKIISSWIEERETTGSVEDKQTINEVVSAIVTNLNSSLIQPISDNRLVNKNIPAKIMGYTKVDFNKSMRYFMMQKATFEKLFCKDIKYRKLMSLLGKEGLIVREDSSDRLLMRHTIEGERHNLITFDLAKVKSYSTEISDEEFNKVGCDASTESEVQFP